MECKICKKEFKGKIGLNTHLKTHSIKPLQYIMEYENFKIPKCICGNNRKQIGDEINFFSTCCNKMCIKKILSEKRLNFMKNNPEQTAWRTKNISYPEQKFIELIKQHQLDKHFLITREKCEFPYFIDFAFEQVKVAIEIDGSQHELKERKKKDEKKDITLISNGWKIFRITAKEVLTKGDQVIYNIIKFIGSDKKFDNCGLKIDNSKRQIEIDKLNKERLLNSGLTEKQKNSCLSQRIVKRPPLDQLQQEIKNLGYSAVGRKYGVSDNAIRRWIKTYKQYNI